MEFPSPKSLVPLRTSAIPSLFGGSEPILISASSVHSPLSFIRSTDLVVTWSTAKPQLIALSRSSQSHLTFEKATVVEGTHAISRGLFVERDYPESL